MKFFALLVLVAVPFLAVADEHGEEMEDGPCPHPAAAEGLDDVDWSGHWYAIGTNCQHQVADRHCLEVKVETDGGVFKSQIHFKDPEGHEHHWFRKFTQIEGQHGRYESYNKTDDGWVKNGWVYTVIAIHGDAALEYVCREEGDHHRGIHRVFSRTYPVAPEDKAAMEAAYAAIGDSRKPISYKHDNCEYKWA